MEENVKKAGLYEYNLVSCLLTHGEDVMDLVLRMADKGWLEYMGPASYRLGGPYKDVIVITSVIFRRPG